MNDIKTALENLSVEQLKSILKLIDYLEKTNQ